MKTDPVIIRVSRNDPSDVFALFPAIPGTRDWATCTCYQHVGQHCSADYNLCIRASRPATKQEGKSLLQELQQIGYRPRIIRRAGRKYLNQRIATVQE